MTSYDQLLVSLEAPSPLRQALALRTAIGLEALSDIFVATTDDRFERCAEDEQLAPIRLFPRVRRKRSDVLMVHAGPGLDTVVDLIGGLAKHIVLVHHAHTCPAVREAERSLLPVVDRVIAPTPFEAADAVALGADRALVAMPPLTWGHVAPDQADPVLSERLSKGRQVVVAVGDPVPGSRLEDVVAAVAIAQLDYPLDVDIVVFGAGDPVYEASLARWAKQLGLVGRLVLAGDQSMSERTAWLRWAAMVVSFSASGGLDLDLMDAMTVGIPIIARDFGHTRDQLAGGGLLLPADTGPTLVAEAIGQLWIDPDLRVEVAMSGHIGFGEALLAHAASPLLPALEGLG